MKKQKVRNMIIPLVVLILEALPWGAVLNFANPEGEPWRRTYSYFSLTPFGYANFGPFITAVLTCVLAVLALIALFKGGAGPHKTMTVLSAIGFAVSLSPLLYGLRYFTVIGGCISVLLLLNTVLLIDKTEKTPGS